MRLSRWVFFSSTILFFFFLLGILASGQGARVRSEYTGIEDADRDHPGERDRWFMRGRKIPGQSAAGLRYRAHREKMQLRVLRRAAGKNAATVSLSAGMWGPLGPSPLASDASGFGQQDYDWVSGRATAVAVDSADASGNTVYVGGAYGGVWKSTNAGPLSQNPSGVHWIPLTDDQATLAVGAVAIQPQLNNPDPNRSVILVGTGETNSSADSYYGLGMLRSADAGNTWLLITQSSDVPSPRPFQGLGFSKIAFSSTNPQLVVAAAAGAVQGIIENLEDPSTVNRGLYFSSDGGVSWRYASVKDGSNTIDPGSATTVAFNAGAGKFYAAMRYHGFYSSGDGVNWTRLGTQPGSGLSSQNCPPSPSSGNCPIYRGEITVVPGRNEMYAWYVDATETDQGIYRSVNGGTTWTAISTGGITSCGDLSGCGTAQGLYNLELAAVPSGTVTDLYAGAINLYKCTITNSEPNCTGSGSNTFLNLTHVYGCSAIAKVHPDQHALDFKVVNGKDIMYFANDGGVYRALDGYTGLTAGTCGLSNQFDSLNQTLGSMTQFVSFAQHPTDANTILGGTQDNGSPATASSQSSSQWLNVNAGDGGYNALNPHSTDEWFTANTGVSIQRCTLGINCHTQDFSAVVQPENLASDRGGFYTPYILDPLMEMSELIVGTCRVWRGPGTGGAFTQLSINFETGSPTGACTGTEANLVRSLAAGGSADAGGFSKVIYAGTDGLGPQLSGTPAGGHLWVSTNSSGGVNTWFNRTGSINPLHFPVSSVAVDAADPLGLTAYVTIMGFGVSHVWKTTNAGSSWSDFTGNLPDAPANAIVVDPGPDADNGTLYVGTDVGVFFSGTSSPNWTELGPSPEGGQSGFLPNVAVTALRLFDIGTTKLLRASTYGRGVWQYPLTTTPDFAISISHAEETIFPTQTATLDGALTAFNGYNSPVTLSCAAGDTPPPGTCDLEPASVTPAPNGAGFTLTEGGAIGDYRFKVRGAGSDADKITHDSLVTLHVVDFGLTSPVPSATTANRPNDSDPVTFQVTASGSFEATVMLSCAGLPAGAACVFTPASSVRPTSGSPVTVTMIIHTSTGTPTGKFAVVIAADTSGAPAVKTQNLSLTVTALADFTLGLGGTPAPVPVNHAVTVNGTLAAYNGYASVVDLACAGQAPPACELNPASLTPSAGGTDFNLTVNSSSAANYSFTVQGTGTDPAATTHSAPLTVTFFDFDLQPDTDSQSVPAGQAADYSLFVTPLGLPTFHDSVTFSCTSGLPALSSCSFNPTQVNRGEGAGSVLLRVQTTAPIAFLRPAASPWLYGIWLLLPGLVLGFARIRKSGSGCRRASIYSGLVLVVALGLVMAACGGGSGGAAGTAGGAQPGTPKGTYTITVQATSGTLKHSQQLKLSVQ